MPTTIIKLPLPRGYYYALAFLCIVGLAWLGQGYVGLGICMLALVPLVLPLGQKFELEPTQRRYRYGLHWAGVLNPAWQPLPAIRHVAVKPYSYRQRVRNTVGGIRDEGISHEFVVLLTPDSTQGIVAAHVKSATRAEGIAAELAAALQVPWHRV